MRKVMNRQMIVNKLLAILAFTFLTFAAQAGEPVSKSFFGGVAIDGQDTVAYHNIGASEPH